jgi:hypothetical protein
MFQFFQYPMVRCPPIESLVVHLEDERVTLRDRIRGVCAAEVEAPVTQVLRCRVAAVRLREGDRRRIGVQWLIVAL